ncbi:MAG: EAL domain-containing protein [Campylobacterota bacterium]|nr:EAL domain-containing protein [Campylobacterota bacterium]
MLNIKNIIKYTKNLKLLYVEDNKEARESVVMMLEEFFDDITTAIDGEDGCQKFKDNTIDLILTDINMPKLNGLEMIKKIREIDKSIPILVLSAYNETDFFMESIKLGVDGYLFKPIERQQFIRILEKVIQKLQLKDENENNIQLLNQYQEATDHSSIVSKTNTKGIITYVNNEFTKISGYKKEELIGKNHNIVRHPDNPSSIFKDMWDTIKNNKQTWQGTLRNIDKYGKSYYVKTTVKPILNKDNNIIEYIALRDDITDIMNPKKQLQDLINSSKTPFAVMIKIENFEDIEKFYGQKMAQKIEDQFSLVLESKIPENCEFEKVFPIGDGEYVFAKDKEYCKDTTKHILTQLRAFQNSLNLEKIDIGEVEYDISVIISIAYGNDVLENLKYGIKKLIETKSDFILANDLAKEEQNQAKQNIDTLKTIKQAIYDFKIISYFQPIINNKTKKIEKYESLVRLEDETGKILPPFFFLDTAKRGKYYSAITSMVLHNSFNALSLTKADISINLSALDIEQKSTRDNLLDLIKANKSDAKRVVFELLEDENVKDFKTIISFIEEVKKYGIKIAIDDFGAGYSNFERLLDYQPDILKIDGSLIKNILTDKFSLNVVETIVTFAKKQNMKIVAEYVENEEIFNLLCSLDIDYSQGYFFGKPEPLTE